MSVNKPYWHCAVGGKFREIGHVSWHILNTPLCSHAYHTWKIWRNMCSRPIETGANHSIAPSKMSRVNPAQCRVMKITQLGADRRFFRLSPHWQKLEPPLDTLLSSTCRLHLSILSHSTALVQSLPPYRRHNPLPRLWSLSCWTIRGTITRGRGSRSGMSLFTHKSRLQAKYTVLSDSICTNPDRFTPKQGLQNSSSQQANSHDRSNADVYHLISSPSHIMAPASDWPFFRIAHTFNTRRSQPRLMCTVLHKAYATGSVSTSRGQA